MSGPSISGGGSIAVDTAEMDHAAAVLATARTLLVDLAARAAVTASVARPDRRAYLDVAHAQLALAEREAGQAEDGLRTAARRYGQAEEANTQQLRTAFAAAAAARGWTSKGLLMLAGPFAVPGIVAMHAAPVAATLGALFAYRLGTGTWVPPESDPVLRRLTALTVSSLDDEERAFLGTERAADLVRDRPAAPGGTQSIAAGAARALGAVGSRQGGPIRTQRTVTEWTSRPQSIAELANRLPDGSKPAGQVRIEGFAGPTGRHWIVYISGTVTFLPDSGAQPFDMGSNLLGVADRTSDAQRVVQEAMRQAGIRPGEPVLLVGHSQGALTAVRIAQHAGYDVGGVVEFGGPTGQIALPASVPVVAVEHDQDIVPALGGLAAPAVAGGANRLLIRRDLPDVRPRLGSGAAGLLFPAHDTQRYAETTRMAERSTDPRMAAFRAKLAPFLDGTGATTDTFYRGDRVSAPTRRVPTGVAGRGRRPSR